MCDKSVEFELAFGLLLGLIEESGGHGLYELIGASLCFLLVHAGEWVPVLVALVLALHLIKTDKHAFLVSGRPEVQLHTRVVAVLQACLSTWLSIVESAIEVGDGFGIELAGVEAVGEDHASRSLLVEVALVDLLRLVTHGIDSHLVFGTGTRRVKVIIPCQHFFLSLFNYNIYYL